MNYISIAERQIPLLGAMGSMSRLMQDTKRYTEGYTLPITHAEAVELFTEGVQFSLLEAVTAEAEDGTVQETEYLEHNKSHLALPCGVLDNLDGTVTVYMGEYTTEEMLLMEVLGNV